MTSSSGDDVSTANGRSLQEEHLYQRTITYIGHIEYKRQSSVLRTPASAQKITIIYILASHNVNVNRPWSWPPHTNKSRLGQWDTGLCIIHLLSYLLSNNIQVTKMFESLEASSKLKWLSQQLNKKYRKESKLDVTDISVFNHREDNRGCLVRFPNCHECHEWVGEPD